MRALIIDDSKAVRSLLRTMLQDLGFDVAEASDGMDALGTLHELGPVDLALVDWNMPRLDGLQFVTAVRAKPIYKGMLLVMVTTETDRGKVAQALAAGANEYIMKPFTREIVEEKLRLLGIDV